MKAIAINQYGTKEELEEQEVILPKLKEHQVLIKVKATSINPIDWKLREGYLKQMFDWSFPIILGWDVAGVIEEVGSQVTSWNVGDRVFARPETTRFGTYAEKTIVDDHLLASIPENVTFDEAAAVPLAGLTAWQALFDHGQLKAGEKVLIHAGAGGVGTYAIQLAKNAGAYVITTASEKNHDLLEKLGADEVIDYHKTNVKDVLNNIDLVFDTMGGAIQKESISVLKAETGRLISIVGITPETENVANEKNVVVKGIWLNPDGIELKKMANLLEAKKIRSVIGAVFPFSREGIYEAHALSETHHALGKIVISMTK